MSHRDLQEDIGLELPFAGNMIAEGHERTDGPDRPTIATPSQLDHTTWLMTNNSQPGRWFESLQGATPFGIRHDARNQILVVTAQLGDLAQLRRWKT